MSFNSILNALRYATNGVTTLLTKNKSLGASSQSYGSSVSIGAMIAALDDPFAGRGLGSTTYSTFGTVPSALALNGNRVQVADVPLSNTSYDIGIMATSGDGNNVIGETLTFKTGTVTLPTTVLANPAPPTPVITTVASSPAPVTNTGSPSHYVEATVPNSGAYWSLTIGSTVEGYGIKYEKRNDTRFWVRVVNDATQSGPEDGVLPAKSYVEMTALTYPATLRLERNKNLETILYVNGVMVPNSLVTNYVGHATDTYAYARAGNAPNNLTDIKISAVATTVTPLVINTANVTNNKAVLDIAYYSATADTFECQFEDGLGGVLSPWANVEIVSNLAAGSAIVRSSQAVPGDPSVTLRLRLKATPAVSRGYALRVSATLLPNPIPVDPAPTTFASTASSGLINTGGEFNYVEGTVGDVAWRYCVAASADNKNRVFYGSISASRYEISYFINNVKTVYNASATMPTAAAGTVIRVQKNRDGSVSMLRNGVVVSGSTLPASIVATVADSNNKYASSFNDYGSVSTDVKIGSLASYTPLVISSTAITNDRVNFTISYVMPVSGIYECQFEDTAGNVHSAWADTMVLANSVAGTATIRSSQLAPAAAKNGVFVARLRQKEDVSIKAVTTVGYLVAMPIYTIASTYSAPEGDAGTTVFPFPVTRNYGSIDATINWRVEGITASATDFVGDAFPSGTLRFPLGITAGTININVKGETAVEGDETFNVIISDPSPNGGVGTSIGTILNDDSTAVNGLKVNPAVQPTPISYGTNTYTNYINSGSLAHFVEATVGDVAWVMRICSDGTGDNMIRFAGANGTSCVRQVYRDGVLTSLTNATYPAMAAGTVLRLARLTDGSVAFYKNGTLVTSSIISAADMETYTQNMSSPSFTMFNVDYGGAAANVSMGSLAPDPIKVISATRQGADLNFIVNYTMDTSSTYECQIEQPFGTVISAWKEVTILANVTAGNAALRATQAMPATGFFTAKLRQKNLTGANGKVVVAAGGTAFVIGMAGSSSPEKYVNDGTGVKNNFVRYNTGAAAAKLTSGTFGLAAGNIISNALSRGVDYIRGGVGGSTLAMWDANTYNVRTNFTSQVVAVGGCDIVLLQVGWNDVNTNIVQSQAAQVTLLRSLIAKIRTETNLPNLKIVLGATQDNGGRLPTVSMQRRAELLVANTDANVYYGFSTHDLDTIDNIHQTEGAMNISGPRFADQVLAIWRDNTQRRGSFVSGAAAFSATQTDVTITHRTGTDITPLTGITGFTVVGATSGTNLAITAAERTSATTVRLTHADTAGETVVVSYMPNDTNTDKLTVLRDNSALTLPVESSATTFTVAPIASNNPAPVTAYQATGNAAKISYRTPNEMSGFPAGWNARFDTVATLALKNADGSALPWSDNSPSRINLSNTSGANTDGVVPAEITRVFWYRNPGDVETQTWMGLDDTKFYDIVAFGSRNATDRYTAFAIGSTGIVLDVSNNSTRVATFSKVAPTGGKISMTWQAGTGTNGVGSAYGYLNAVIITEYTKNTQSPLTVTPVDPAYSDSFDGDGALSVRPNWVIQSGEAANWKTLGGSLHYTKTYGSSSYVYFGDDVSNQTWTFEYSTLPGSDAWDNSRQLWYIWYKDSSNYVQVSLSIDGSKKVSAVNLTPMVGGVAKTAIGFIPRGTLSQTGTINIILGLDTVRCMVNGTWCEVYTTFNYPFDRVNYTRLAVPIENRIGKAAWMANTWDYARGAGMSITPLAMTLDNIDDFVGEDSLTSKGGTATLTGTFVGTPTKWVTKITNEATGTVVKDWAVTTDVVVSGSSYTARVFIPTGGPYIVTMGWMGADGKTRMAQSTPILSGINIVTYGQSNSFGRGYGNGDTERGKGWACYSDGELLGFSMPAGKFASSNNSYPSSRVMMLAKVVSERLKIPVSASAFGTNGAGIGFLADGGGWSTFTGKRANIKGVIRAVVWDQGEGDSDGTVSFTTDYASIFRTRLLPNLRTSALNPNLKVTIAQVGNYPGGGLSSSNSKSDTQRSQLKNAYLDILANEPTVSFSSSKLGVNHGDDSYHYTADGYREICRRDGLSVAKALSPEIVALYGVTSTATYDGRGPIATGLELSGSTASITLNLNGATGVSAPITTATFTGTVVAPTHPNSYNGYQFSTDDFATVLAVNSMAMSGGKLVFVLAAAPTGTLKVRSMWGSTYDDRTLFYGTYADGTSIPVAPIITPIAAAVVANAVNASIPPDSFDTFDGDGSLSSRAGWTVPSGDTAKWTTSGGQLLYSGPGTSVVTLGSTVGDHIVRIDYDCSSSSWNNEYQFLRIWQKDATNYLRVRLDASGSPRKLTQISFEAVIDGVVQSKKPIFFPNLPAVATTTGTLEVVMAQGSLRCRFNNHWSTSNYLDFSYPFDRVAVTDFGITADKQNGVFAFVGATASYARANLLSVSSVFITVDFCDDFVAQIAVGSPDCKATVSGTYTGSPVFWQYRIWDGTMTTAGAWKTVTPTLATNGLYNIDVILQHNTDNYVEVAWVGSDSLYRSARSTLMQTGDVIMYYGQSNSYGRREFYNYPKGLTYANFVKDVDQDGAYPRGRVASLYVDLPASSSMAAAKTVNDKTGIRTAVMVTGVNATGIAFLSPPGGGWGVFTRDRAKVKGIIKAFIWDQGENDADGASVTADYADRFINTLMPALVESSGNPNVKIAINLVGNYPSGGPSGSNATANDVRRANIRDQQQDIVNRAAGRVVWGSSKLGLNHGGDDYHYTGEAYAEGSSRDGLSVARAILGTGFDGRGPILSGMSRSGKVITLTATLNGSTTITGPTFKQTSTSTRIPPAVANSMYGYQVALASGDFNTLLPIESITTNGTGLVITLVTDPGAAVKVRSMAGATYDDTNLFYGDSGLPVWPIITPLLVSSSNQMTAGGESMTAGGAPMTTGV